MAISLLHDRKKKTGFLIVEKFIQKGAGDLRKTVIEDAGVIERGSSNRGIYARVEYLKITKH